MRHMLRFCFWFTLQASSTLRGPSALLQKKNTSDSPVSKETRRWHAESIFHTRMLLDNDQSFSGHGKWVLTSHQSQSFALLYLYKNKRWLIAFNLVNPPDRLYIIWRNQNNTIRLMSDKHDDQICQSSFKYYCLSKTDNEKIQRRFCCGASCRLFSLRLM